MAVGSLQSAANPPAERHDEAFWMGHYIGLVFGPLIPLSLGLGLRRAAKGRARLQGASETPAESPRKWSAVGAVLTAVFLIGTVMAFPPKGDDWSALNIAGVAFGACLTLGAAYMAVRPRAATRQ